MRGSKCRNWFCWNPDSHIFDIVSQESASSNLFTRLLLKKIFQAYLWINLKWLSCLDYNNFILNNEFCFLYFNLVTILLSLYSLTKVQKWNVNSWKLMEFKKVWIFFFQMFLWHLFIIDIRRIKSLGVQLCKYYFY